MADNCERRMGPDRATLLMTRHAAGNAAFLRLLPTACRSGLRVIESPLIEIEPVPFDPPAGGETAAIFTSANGVHHAPPGAGRAAFCVGSRTTQAAQEAGWRATCAGKDAESLLGTLLADPPPGPLVHYSGVHQRGDVADRLAAAGITAERRIVYAQRALPLTDAAIKALVTDNAVIVPLFSPRSAALFAEFLSEKMQPALVAISSAVAGVLPLTRRDACRIAATPSAEAVAKEVEKLVARRSLG